MFKFGDKVRVLSNRHGAYSPTEERLLNLGETFKVLVYQHESSHVWFKTFSGALNYVDVKDVELVPNICTCSVMDLILGGTCTCGAVVSGS